MLVLALHSRRKSKCFFFPRCAARNLRNNKNSLRIVIIMDPTKT